MDVSRIVSLILGIIINLGGYRAYIAILGLIGFVIGAIIIGPVIFGLAITLFMFGD